VARDDPGGWENLEDDHDYDYDNDHDDDSG
jgi:hypothetical protein